MTAFLALALVLAFNAAALAQTGTISGTVTSKDGKPLAYANVILVGTNLGAMSLADGKFKISGVPNGTYTVKALMMGYKFIEKKGIKVSGRSTDVSFVLEQTIVAKTQEIVVTADKPMVEVTSSDARGTVTSEQLQEMPVDDVLEAVALKAGIIKSGDEMYVRGGRSSEVQVQIDGVQVVDPLGGGTAIHVGMLGTAGSEIVSGGMDAEYGNAQSAVINITTKEGGRRFGGEFRYFTDDFGRQDKTYTNFDRVSIGFGGPTWWKSLRYYVSGEATFTDTENTTIEPRPEHKITDWLKFRQRQTEAFNLQTKLTYSRQRVKITGEAIATNSRRDQYINNWNIAGFVAKQWYFQGVGRTSPAGVFPEIFEFTRPRTIAHGKWAEIENEAERERVLNIRPVVVIALVRDANGEQQVVRYDNFRVADIGSGAAREMVIWDEAILSDDGSTVLFYKPWTLFEGFQFGGTVNSNFKPFLRDPSGADSSFVPFNSATRTPETRSDNLQLKIGFNHNITSKVLYSIKLSRLELHRTTSVTDGNGQLKLPQQYETAGNPLQLPGDPDADPVNLTTAQWYTDDDFPYFVTAYDYPFYSDQTTIQWLTRGDITSEQYKGHRMKAGFQLIYNDLTDDERSFPGQTRVSDTGEIQQGLNVNIYNNYNTEGAFYFQDKWEYEGMVLNGGLRYEWFRLNNISEIPIQSSEIDSTVQKFKQNLSPRLGFAFPITDRDKFFFHYGRFTQWPSHNFLFRTQDAIGALGTLGNPNLEPQLTIAYQAGISHQFTDDVAGSFIVFNKDIYGLISSSLVTDDSTGVQRFRYTNRTYASSRGLEISLEKRLTRRLGFEVYYTYSFADGVASDADFGRSAAGLTHLPTEEQPLDWDQRHTFNVTLRLRDGNNWGATTIYSYGSGMPWTPFDRFARLQDPTAENSMRLEPSHILSVQGRKQFNIYGRELTLYFEGKNLLDNDVLLLGQTAPGAAPVLENGASMDGGSYLTETGEYGGAYLQDIDDDGLNEFIPVFDPTIWQPHRSWRLGFGFEF